MATSTEIISQLEELFAAQAALATSLRQHASFIWLPNLDDEDASNSKTATLKPVSQHPKALNEAIAAYNTMEYVDGQDGRATFKLKGVVLVQKPAIEAAAAVNLLRMNLAQSLDEFSAGVSKKESLASRLDQDGALRQLLSHAGIVRLNINHVRRLLPVVETTPYRVSFLEKRFPSYDSITLDEAEERLNKLSSAQAQIDREALGRLRPGTKLVVISPKNLPAQKANIFHSVQNGASIDKYKQQIHAPLPILCLASEELPRIHRGGFRNNTKRSDRRICETPYLISIRAHLYEGGE